MTPQKVCYLGDDFLSGAAGYLAGVMLHHGIEFDYVPSAERPPESFSRTPYALYVVSDYPAARFDPADVRHIVNRVREGAGLLMLGGWESFYGRVGEYHRSPLAEALPVVMTDDDDRVNCPQPCLIRKVSDHPIVDGLPWDRPPCIGGFNILKAKQGGQIVLGAVRFDSRIENRDFQFSRRDESPLLIAGQFGRGRTAALATDAAPHWVGGLVDWGDGRIVQNVAEGQIEVGNWYARFFRNLLVWTGKLQSPLPPGEG